MLRKILLTGAAVSAFSMAVSAGAANATTISFAGFPNGVPVTTIDGVTFSLQQGAYGNPANAVGPPVTGPFGDYGQLSNSQTGEYPTADILDVSFSGGAHDISFFFNNIGVNYSSTATAFGKGGVLEGSTALGGYAFAYGAYGSVAGNSVVDLQFNNGEGTYRSWQFGIGEITFSPGVPEPASWALMLTGLGFLGYVLRRRVERAARAA
jgi:hypothetical protein